MRLAVSMAVWLLLLTSSASVPVRASSGFVTASGTQFVLDGKPFYYGGTNCYYLMVYAADPSLRDYVDEVLEEASELGLTVVRTWAFNDGATQWNALQTAPGVYQEYVFQGLDYVLHKARQLGLRVILTLVNNWDDYGGMNQYVAWAGASGHDQFYTNTQCKDWYKSHVAKVVNRVNTFSGITYKDDPTIFAWELANEPRAQTAGLAVLNNWVQEMSAYVKGLDPNHMVSVGIEGFYSSDKNPVTWMRNMGTDFVTTQQAATVDFAVSHSWPDWWGTSLTQTMNYLQQQITDAHTVLRKPYVLEEFGKKRPISVRDDWYTHYMDLVYANRAGGWNFWILYHDEYPDYDQFGVYYPADTSTISIIESQAARMRSLIPDEGRIQGTISMTTLSAAAYEFSRPVVFEITDSSGGVLSRVEQLLLFRNDATSRTATSEYTLDHAPGAAAWLTARTKHSLKERVAVTYDGNRRADADFVLRGGDLNGDDLVNLLDLSLLKANWNTTSLTADINGDGKVQMLDYAILKSNWYEHGASR